MVPRAARQTHVEVLATVPSKLRDQSSEGIVAGQRPSRQARCVTSGRAWGKLEKRAGRFLKKVGLVQARAVSWKYHPQVSTPI